MTRDEWPLYEVFVRGKRGLNHVHVGSLHAADDEMAVRHARDVYTRRNEGVSIWVVRADAITASSPDEKDPLFAPERRQGLPAPDVLRHPRQRPPHVSTREPTSMPATPTPDPEPDEHGSVYDGLLGTDSSQWAFGTDFEDPLAGVDTTLPDGRRRRRAGGVLPDARRRRAGALPPALGVVQPRAGPRGGHRAGQHRARPARPGPAAAGPGRGRRPDRRPGAARRARRCRRRTRWRSSARPRTSATCGWPRCPTATSRTPSPGCCCSRSARLAVFERLAGSRDPVLAAVAAKGVKELAYHRDYAGRWFLTLARGTEESRRRLRRRRSTSCGRSTPSCWPPTRSRRELAAAGVGVDPATVADEVDVVLEQVFAASGVDRPERRRPGRRQRPHRPRRAAHRGAQPAARRDAGRRPRPPGGAVVTMTHRVRGGCATVTDPEMPMLTLEDLGVLRAVEERRRPGRVAITPTYSGCPAMATMRDDLVHRLTRRRVRRRPGPGRADAGLVERLDQRPTAAASWPSTASPRPGAAPAAGGPVVAQPAADPARDRLPAVRVEPTSSSPRSSGRPPARRSTAARPASSRSST